MTTPLLRILPIRPLLLHERSEPHRVRKLRNALIRLRVMRNPVLVFRDGRSRSAIVIDGVHRVTALRSMGSTHVLAQVTDRNDIQVSAWNHYVCDPSLPERLHVRRPEWKTSQRNPVPRFTVRVTNGTRTFFLPYRTRAFERAGLINDVAERYRSSHRFFRVTNDDVPSIRSEYPQGRWLVQYAPFTLRDIVNCARASVMLPSGITRFVVPRRALNVDIPLSVLRSRTTLRNKNALLKMLVHRRFDANSVRSYDEPIIIYND